jgi:hypothetical protein
MTVYIFEKVWVNVLLNVAYGVVVLGLDLLLIPRYGLLGATIPTSLVTVTTPFVRYAIARRYLDNSGKGFVQQIESGVFRGRPCRGHRCCSTGTLRIQSSAFEVII